MSKYCFLSWDTLTPQLAGNFQEIQRALQGTTYVGNLTFSGNISISGTLAVTGAISGSSTLSIAGTSSLVGAVTLGSTLTLGGNIILNDNYISNDGDDEGISIDDDGIVSTSGNIIVGGNIIIPDSGYIGSVSETSSISIDSSGDVTFINDITVGDTLYTDNTNNRVGIFYASPENRLTVGYGNFRFNAVSAPGACTAALAGAGAGNVDNGNHRYSITFVNDEGETTQGTWSNTVTVVDNATDGKISLTGIPVSSSGDVTSRKIYRTKTTNANFQYLLATLSDNSTTVYTDNTADASLGASGYRRENTTSGIIYLGSSTIFQTGVYVTKIGYRALESLTTGDSTVAVGSEALRDCTSGTENVAIGFYALRLCTTGQSNISIGYGSLDAATDPDHNVAIGSNTLTTGTAIDFSIGIGSFALNQINAHYNVAIGHEAIRYNSTGTYNTALGYNSGKGVSGQSYSHCTLVGNSSGLGLTTGNNNTFIGSLAGDSCTSGTDNIVIGYNQDISSATASNELNIGGVLYGNLSTGTIGVNSVSPDAFLEVIGTTEQLRLTHTDATDYCSFTVDGNGKTIIQSVDGGGAAGHICVKADGYINLGSSNAPQNYVTITGEDSAYSQPGIDFWASLTSASTTYNCAQISAYFTTTNYQAAVLRFQLPSGSNTWYDGLYMKTHDEGTSNYYNRIGLNNTSPQATAHFSGYTTCELWTETVGHSVCGFGPDDTAQLANFISSYGSGGGPATTWDMGFKFVSTVYMVLTKTGQLGVNHSTAAAIQAGTNLDVNGVTLARDKICFTQTDLNEYIDSLADGYIDARYTTGFRFGDGTNYAMFASDGELTLTGTARVWKSVDLPVQVVKLPGANAPAEDNIDNFGFHRYDRGTEESVYYTWVVPLDFAQGDASVKGHYAFVVENPPSGGGNENVRMGFEYKKITEDDVFSFTSGTSSGYIDETITDGETPLILHITSDGTCTTTGWQAHDKILFRFYRDATAPEDTYDNEVTPADNDVWIKNYHLEYLSNKLGEAS